jgi:hypothetical protein
MSSSDDDFDTERHFDEHDEEDESLDAHVWQLLLLINPGDDDTAFQQFTAYRDVVGDADEEDIEPVRVIGQVIDWRSGFQVDADDTRALVQAIDELVSRWNLSIDWEGDPEDDEFHAASLVAIAYDSLAPHGYTLWARETDDGSYAGWITLTRDAEPMRELATALGINLRLGSDVT